MDDDHHLNGASQAHESHGGHQANSLDVVMAEAHEPQHLEMNPLEVDVSSSPHIPAQP